MLKEQNSQSDNWLQLHSVHQCNNCFITPFLSRFVPRNSKLNTVSIVSDAYDPWHLHLTAVSESYLVITRSVLGKAISCMLTWIRLTRGGYALHRSHRTL
jgi:hypothetical protein